jgi:hypothetical protein
MSPEKAKSTYHTRNEPCLELQIVQSLQENLQRSSFLQTLRASLSESARICMCEIQQPKGMQNETLWGYVQLKKKIQVKMISPKAERIDFSFHK